MRISEYISKYYCDETKKDVHLNDIKDDTNLICNYNFYNRFHSVWLPNDKYSSDKFVRICETKEHENKYEPNEGLNNTEGNNFISFEESTTWTSLEYIPFKPLLNQLGYPICECVEKKYFWWGKLKYQEYKSEKIKLIFNIYFVNSENSKEINLKLINEILEREGIFKNSTTITSGRSNNGGYHGGLRSPGEIKTTSFLDKVLKTGKYKQD